ncbi:MAG: outer membrane protein assembly factor BamA [Alphaproteobacteria bacterium]|nr:outer membrane protein assembly factor BamA [Alphaproteobacteria bacterium]
MKKKILIVFFMLFFFGASVFAGTVVDDFKVEGNQRLEQSAILSYLPFEKGDEVSDSDMNKALKALYKTGFFDDVQVDLKGQTVHIKVKERPIISSISFEGNSKISTDVLKGEVQIKVRDIYNPTKVQQDVERMKAIYQRMGLLSATIEADVKNKTRNRKDITFKIKEGSKKYIENIKFEGNKAFSNSDLREQIVSREHRWYRLLSSTDTYDPDRLNYDKEYLRRFYFQHGYIDFEVLDTEVTKNEEDDFDILIKVSEGKRYKIGDVTISTHIPDVKMEDLKKKIALEKGDYYQASLMDETVQSLTDELGREGYAFVDIQPDFKKDKDGIVNIDFKVKETSRVFINRIDILGNSRTLDKVIRREFRLSEGDPFNTDKIRRSRQRIENLGYFDKVDLKTVPVANAPDKTDLAVTVSEKATGAFNVGVGWSTYDGMMFEVGVQERNFLGTGNIIGITASTSDSQKQIDVSLTNPYFMDLPLSAGVDVYHILYDYEDDSSYKSQTTGGAVRFGWEYTERLRQTMKYTLQRDNVKDVDSDASLYIQKQKGKRITSMLGTVLTYDTRDSSIMPTTGYITSAGVDFAGLNKIDKTRYNRFVRLNLNATRYFEIIDKWVFSLNASAGIIEGINQDVRINNAYFLGGYTLRGFESSGVGARDKATDDALGGDWRVTGTAQLMFPLGLPEEFGIRGKLFVEGGTLGKPSDFDRDTMLYSSKIRVSTGFGLLWRSPMGPINIDFGFPIVKEPYDKKEVFRLNFGTGF